MYKIGWTSGVYNINRRCSSLSPALSTYHGHKSEIIRLINYTQIGSTLESPPDPAYRSRLLPRPVTLTNSHCPTPPRSVPTLTHRQPSAHVPGHQRLWVNRLEAGAAASDAGGRYNGATRCGVLSRPATSAVASSAEAERVAGGERYSCRWFG